MTIIIFLSMSKGRVKFSLNKMGNTTGEADFERGRSGGQGLTCKVRDA